MHVTQTVIGQIAAVLAVVQVVPYVRSTLKGKTKPSRTSFGIWAVVQTVSVAGYIGAGATTTALVPLVLAATAIIIFGLSLKYGMRGHGKLDIPCLVVAGAALAVWIVTDNPTLAVYMSTFASAAAYLPTIRKAYLWPQSESKLSWCMFAAAALLNVFALADFSPVIVLPLLISLCLSSTVAGLLVFPRWKFRNLRRSRLVTQTRS